MSSSQSEIGLNIEDVRTPTFMVNKNQVRRNIDKIRKLCDKYGLSLRGQTKTHKTNEVAFMQTGGSKRSLVCSTFGECEFYAGLGYDDILYGFPLQEVHFKQAYDLTKKLDEFHIFTDSIDIVSKLCQMQPPEGKKWSVFLKVDCGGNRVGIWYEDVTEGVKLCQVIQASDTAVLKGVYVHCGNTYIIESMPSAVRNTRNQTIDNLLHFVNELRGNGCNIPVVGIGSTPSCSHDGEKLKLLTEIHPGNYVFYDLQQKCLGSCSEEDIAGCVATRVIGHYPRRNQMLIDCGFTGLSKQGPKDRDFKFGLFRGEPSLRLIEMTQEIGYVSSTNGDPLNYHEHPVGKMLYLLPWHSCATSSLYSKFLVEEKGKITEEWITVPRRGSISM